jgi:hypothetical protein
VRFAKKLLFATLIGASSFDAASLPLSVFVALLALLLLQVRTCRLAGPPRPSARPRC